jgi:FlaA1/EpsC-like NDP-sugar epimerase
MSRAWGGATIPEASQLVLQAAALGKGGEVFILDMGQPVSVLALAQDMIRLSGLEPDKDIEIRFTGIRPGEKLFEELATDEERADKTRHSKVFVGKVRGAANWGALVGGIEDLLSAVDGADDRAVYAGLRRLIPEFTGEKAGTEPVEEEEAVGAP